MHRAVRMAVGGMVAALALTAPAAAQYGGGGGGGTTTTTVASGQELGQLVADASPERVEPGDVVTFESDGGFTPGTGGTVSLFRGRQGASGQALLEVIVGADGTLSFAFAVPDVEPGIYLVVVELDTGERVLAVIVVTGPPPAAAQQVDEASTGGSGSESAAAPVAAPAAVQAMQVSADKELELLEAADDGAAIELRDGQLVATRAPEVEAEGSSTPLVAGLTAAGLAAAGLASRRLRRTRSA